MKNCKIDVNLSERNRARLETKSYESNYTDVPNRALPPALKDELGVIYEALTGDDLPEDSNTFTVRADGGTFKRLYSPTVMSTEGNAGVIIRWGDRDIPLDLCIWQSESRWCCNQDQVRLQRRYHWQVRRGSPLRVYRQRRNALHDAVPCTFR